MSCYVEYDRIQSGRQSIGLCGEWVDAVDIANEPTCLACQRRLAQTAADVFGPEPPLRAARLAAVKPAAIRVTGPLTKRRGAA